MQDLTDFDTCRRCQKCERWRESAVYEREPWLLLDKFPCPPPGSPKAQLLIQLNWTGYLGRRDGCKALRRVAERCNVDLTRVELPVSLSDCEGVFTVFGICSTQCVIAIILACICLIFVFILAIVCYRYVHRADKRLKGTCSKVVNVEDKNDLNTQSQMNRYYVQSQYYYKAGNIPDRRGLPFEARCNENGVEARLLKSIKEIPLEDYHFNDTCSQCRHAASVQSTLSSFKSLQGCEKTYWQDHSEGIQRRVPSNDSLIHRRQIDRQSSIGGSRSHTSYCYECITDTTPNGAYARRCNHSMTYLPRNSSSDIREVTSYHGSKCSDDDRIVMLSRCMNTALVLKNNPRREVISHKAISFTKHSTSNDGRSSERYCYHGSLKDRFYCIDDENQTVMNELQHSTTDIRNAKCSKPKCLSNCEDSVDDKTANRYCIHYNADDKLGNIQGYKYTHNPSYDEENGTSTISKNDQFKLSSRPCTPSELEDLNSVAPVQDSCDTKSRPKCIKQQYQRRRSCEQTNTYSDMESASLCKIGNVLKSDGSSYKENVNK